MERALGSLNVPGRNKAEDALKVSEGQYRALFENVPDGIYRMTVDGRFLAANPGLIEMLGYDNEESFLRVNFARDLLWNPDGWAARKKMLHQYGELRSFEVNLRRKDGQLLIVLDNARTVKDPKGRTLYFEGILTDITERVQRKHEFQIITKIGSALRHAPNRSAMIRVILEQLIENTPARTAALSFYDPCRGEVNFELAKGAASKLTGAWYESGIAPFKYILPAGDLYINNDPDQDDSLISQLASGAAAVAGLPLNAQGTTFGILWVGCGEKLREAQIRLFTSIADLVTNALQRAALHEQTERRLQYLSALRTVDVTITSSLDLRQIFNVILDQICLQLEGDAISILLYNPELQRLEGATRRGFARSTVTKSLAPNGEGLAIKAVRDQHMNYVHKYNTPEFFGTPHFIKEGFVSYYAFPLVAKGQVRGVMEIYRRSAGELDKELINFLETLAGQAAIAIDNVGLFNNLQRSNRELALAYDATIEGWSHALDLRDKETEGHTLRVMEMTLKLARLMGLDEAEMVHIRRGALLHDIGKLGIPDSILLKPGPLTKEEWEVMKKHPIYAYNMLSPISYLQPALDIPYCHHEKWDGSGYPRGLKGEQIPVSARIFAIVDVWDALRSDRPYREAWSEKEVFKYIAGQSGLHFDPKVVKAFFALVRG
jgi:PAS domain S-box-containing protein/putative nucleotidyltransferase with HDIG domain